VEKVNVRGRPDLALFDQSTTPRYYPNGSSPGAAHIRLHAATRGFGIKLREGANVKLSDQQLLDTYMKAYNSPALMNVRGSLRTPNGSLNLGNDLSPSGAYSKLLEWQQEQARMARVPQKCF
jgi:hypothetical protein